VVETSAADSIKRAGQIIFKRLRSIISLILPFAGVLAISGVFLIASKIYTSPAYRQFKRPLEYLGIGIGAIFGVGFVILGLGAAAATFWPNKSHPDKTLLKYGKKCLRDYFAPLILGALLISIVCVAIGFSPFDLAGYGFCELGGGLLKILQAIFLVGEGGKSIILFLGALAIPFAIGKLMIHGVKKFKRPR